MIEKSPRFADTVCNCHRHFQQNQRITTDNNNHRDYEYGKVLQMSYLYLSPRDLSAKQMRIHSFRIVVVICFPLHFHFAAKKPPRRDFMAAATLVENWWGRRSRWEPLKYCDVRWRCRQFKVVPWNSFPHDLIYAFIAAGKNYFVFFPSGFLLDSIM